MPAEGSCPGRHRPAVGFEFLTAEAGDREVESSGPAGVGPLEVVEIDRLRSEDRAAIVLLSVDDFGFAVSDNPAEVEVRSRNRDDAEQYLRREVRRILDELRGEGYL